MANFVFFTLIKHFIIPIQKNRKGGMLLFVITYLAHDFFWVFSYTIDSTLIKCAEFYLYYIITWVIIDCFFEGEGFVNFVLIYAADFVLRTGIFTTVFLTTGIFGQFNSDDLALLRAKNTPEATIVYLLSVLVGYCLARLAIRLYQRYRNKWPAFIVILLLAATQMVLEVVESAESIYIVLPSMLIFLFSSVLIQTKKLEQQEKMKLYYRTLEKQEKERQEQFAKIRHDLANHIGVISNMQDEMYTEKLLHKVEKEMHTGVLIVDCLFEEKEKICQREGIMVYKNYTLLSESCVTNFDWISLFSNLLDNAIEACGHVEGEKRITYGMERKGEYLLFTIINSKHPNFQPIQEEFLTTKKDIMKHGYGAQIIRDIVKKYDGRIRYEDAQTEMKAYLILHAWE